MPSADCLCIGILVADHLCTPIDHLPAAGELIVADALPLAVGGCAANVAIDLARLGVPAAVVGCVGKDPLGDFVTQALADQGVGTHYVRRVGTPTSGTLIINVQGEDRRFIHAFGANAEFNAGHVPAQALSGVRVVYLGGYLLLPSLDPLETAELFRKARGAGARTILDVVVPHAGDHQERLTPVLRETDVFLPNEDEGRLLTGESDPVRQARQLLSAGAGTVIVTRGGQGCVVARPGSVAEVDAFHLPFAGATGAGDAFVAGYVAALLDGREEKECLAWASAVGASCVRDISATASVFRRHELQQFLAENPVRYTPI